MRSKIADYNAVVEAATKFTRSVAFKDVLLLLKIDGEWKCVAKVYNQNSNTLAK